MSRTLLFENRLLAGALACYALLAAIGCTSVYQTYLKYTPTPNPLRIANSKSPLVQVEVTDKRQTDVVMMLSADEVRKVEYIPYNDPVEILKDAFRTELKNRGFSSGSGGNSILVTLSYWRAERIKTSFFGSNVIAGIGLDVMIKRADGSDASNRYVPGRSAPWLASHPPPDGENLPVTESTEAAMQDALATVFSDPAFINALKAG